MTLDKSFHFLEVAYPYVAKRLLTDETLRDRLIQVCEPRSAAAVWRVFWLRQEGPTVAGWVPAGYLLRNSSVCEG